jgi:DNA-binding response OmpR family regulator
VEDVRRLADDIAEGLRDQGMAVDVTYDGLTAAEKTAVTSYDVVVLDRDLPGLHGDVLCRQITAAEQPAMVIMLTAAGSPGDRVSGLTLGADDYLPKPFHFPELVLRVRSLARRRPSAKPRILRAAGIELDPALRTAVRLGRPLRLSPKEFEVLAALLTAAPMPLSAEQLLERVWDENTDPFTKTVPVTVARLRRKLGPPEVIVTVAGAGYRIGDGADGAGSEGEGRGRSPDGP